MYVLEVTVYFEGGSQDYIVPLVEVVDEERARENVMAMVHTLMEKRGYETFIDVNGKVVGIQLEKVRSCVVGYRKK